MSKILIVKKIVLWMWGYMFALNNLSDSVASLFSMVFADVLVPVWHQDISNTMVT